jgi:hypothetical protein
MEKSPQPMDDAQLQALQNRLSTIPSGERLVIQRLLATIKALKEKLADAERNESYWAKTHFDESNR